MVQIKGTEEIQDDGKGQLAFKSFLKYFWTIALLITSFIVLVLGALSFSARKKYLEFY
jgi:hypothetical protein